MPRDPLGRHYTPAWQCRALLDRHPIVGRVLEPCAGDGGLTRVLEAHGCEVVTGDIDDVPVDHRWDFIQVAARGEVGELVGEVDWLVTNPPYRVIGDDDKTKYGASDFVRACLSVTDRVALLLRWTWAEPCLERTDIFRQQPPGRVIVLPRAHFRRPKVGEGLGVGTEYVTTAWFVWSPELAGEPSGARLGWVLPEDADRYRGQLSLLDLEA